MSRTMTYSEAFQTYLKAFHEGDPDAERQINDVLSQIDAIKAGKDKTWELTGGIREKKGWLGTKILVEEHARVFSPVVTGYSPSNWRIERRFRQATADELITLGRKLHFASIFEPFNLDIPMPPNRIAKVPVSGTGIDTEL